MTQCVIKLVGNGGQGGEEGGIVQGGVKLTLCRVVLISETPS